MSRPRIRYLKPEIWLSRDFQALSPVGRLTFLALISNADDEGRLKTDAAHLATTYLPGCATDEIAAQLEAMETRRMAIAYAVRGVRFVALLGWSAHQRISHATPSDLPAPPKFKRGVGANNRQLDLDSLRRAPEHSGSRARLRTSSSSSSSSTVSSSSTDISVPDAGTELALVQDVPAVRTPVEQVFDAWIAATERSGRTQLDPKRHRLISGALKGYPLADVIAAVRGWRHSPYHRGENDRATVYNDLDLLLRDAKHIEQFRDLEQHAPSALAVSKQHPLDRWAEGVMGGNRGQE